MSSREHNFGTEEDDYGYPAETGYDVSYDAPRRIEDAAPAMDTRAAGRDLEWHSVVHGTVAEVHEGHIKIHVEGARYEGRVFARELDKLEPALQQNLRQPGFRHDFYVQRTPRPRTGAVHHEESAAPFYELTISGLWREADWEKAVAALNTGETLQVVPLNYNKGGLIVRFGNALEGFVPNSHIWNSPRDTLQREQALRRIVDEGRELTVKVIEVSRENGKLVLSNREVAREQHRANRRHVLQTLQVGAVLTGVVRNIRDFGAFVDVGGVEGLLHISEIDWDLVKHPRDFLSEGQEIEVKVLQIDHAKGHIKLSRKALLETPWKSVKDRYRVGDIVWVDITRKKDFGAFAYLEAGVEGLIHVSEIAPPTEPNPLSTIQEGDRVEVKIIRMDVQNQRIGLSRAQVL